MTVLENSIRIDAPPEKVWSALASLDALHHYDPGVKNSEIISPTTEGLGASRHCDLAAGGWFKEKVAEWKPCETLAFELVECTLPVRRLKYRYTLKSERGGTLVSQHMEYARPSPVRSRNRELRREACFAGPQSAVEATGRGGEEDVRWPGVLAER